MSGLIRSIVNQEGFQGFMREHTDHKDPTKPHPVLNGILVDVSEQIHIKPCSPAHFRDGVIQQIFGGLNGNKLSNVLLHGPAGSGKTAIARTIANMIKNGDERVPANFKNSRVFFIKAIDLIAGTKLRGQAEERIKYLLEFAEANGRNILLVIDEIGSLNISLSEKNGVGFGPFLSSMDNGQFPLLGMTTSLEFEKLGDSPAFLRRFQAIELLPLTLDHTVQALALDHVASLRQYGVYKTFDLIEEVKTAIVHLAAYYEKNEGLPSSAYKVYDGVLNGTIAKKEITKDFKLTLDDVLDYISQQYHQRRDEVEIALKRSLADPSVNLIPRGSILDSYTHNVTREVSLNTFTADGAVVEEALMGLWSSTNPIVFVVGDKGVGKTALIHDVALKMGKDSYLKGRAVVKLSLDELAYDIENKRITEIAFCRALKQYARKIVLYVENASIFFGSTKQGSLFGMLQDEIRSGALPVIIETTPDDPIYRSHASYGTTVRVEEMDAFQTEQALLRQKDKYLKNISTKSGKTISVEDGAISKALKVSKRFFKGPFPGVAFKALEYFAMRKVKSEDGDTITLTAGDIPNRPPLPKSLFGKIFVLLGEFLSSVTSAVKSIASRILQVH